MADENNQAEPVIQPGDTAQVAAERISEPTGDTEAQAAAAQAQEHMIPKSRFDEINEKRKLAETEAQILRQQIEVLSRPVQQTQHVPKTIRQQAIESLGLQDLEYLTVQQQIQVDEIVDNYRNNQVASQSFIASNPDFSQIVGGINPVTRRFEPSEYLKEAIRANPALTGLDNLAMTNPGAAAYAYAVSKQAKQLMELQNASQVSQQTLQAAQNQQNLINQTYPMSSAAVGGATRQAMDSKVDSMTDEQFQQYLQDVKSGKYDNMKG